MIMSAYFYYNYYEIIIWTGIVIPKINKINVIVLFLTKVLYSAKYSSVDYSIL